MISYCMIRDDDAHWYIIPEDKIDAFNDHVYGKLKTAEMPHWADRIGGSPSIVRFPAYYIGSANAEFDDMIDEIVGAYMVEYMGITK